MDNVVGNAHGSWVSPRLDGQGKRPPGEASSVLSVGLDGSDLHGRLGGGNVGRIYSNKLDLSGFRYPVGRGGLDDCQRNQRDHNKYRQRKKNGVPVPICIVMLPLGSIERAVHGYLLGENLHPAVY